MKTRREKTLHLVQLAMLLAIVVVLQLTGASLPIGLIPLTFVLIPIVVGAFLLGPIDGAILGFAFGLITVIQTPQNPYLMIFFEANPVLYVILAILKATLAGLCSGLIYKGLNKLFKDKHKILSTTLASISAPIINTGVFVIGMLIFFFPQLEAMPTANLPEGVSNVFAAFTNPYQVLFIGFCGFNFVGEFLVSLLLSPAVVRIIDIVKKKIKI